MPSANLLNKAESIRVIPKNQVQRMLNILPPCSKPPARLVKQLRVTMNFVDVKLL